MSAVPAVVVAAPSSGSGKTTIATGLMAALRQAGHRVAPFKVGPDFIDPGYHALASAAPGRNLDPVLVGEDLIAPLYRHGSDGADIAVIEGVMGLFDGRIDDWFRLPARGSTGEVAGLLGAPVVLVVDARGQSHSIAAVLQRLKKVAGKGAAAAAALFPLAGLRSASACARRRCRPPDWEPRWRPGSG